MLPYCEVYVFVNGDATHENGWLHVGQMSACGDTETLTLVDKEIFSYAHRIVSNDECPHLYF